MWNYIKDLDWFVLAVCFYIVARSLQIVYVNTEKKKPLLPWTLLTAVGSLFVALFCIGLIILKIKS